MVKRYIRQGVYETNSSSTHTICISKKCINPSTFPDHVTFKHGEFGWEFNIYTELESKASYLYQSICDCNDENDRENKLSKISQILGEYGISCDFEQNKDPEFYDGYIDHAYDTVDFCHAVLNNREKLLQFLFGDSFIVTGNDNDDAYDEYMKGECAIWNAPFLQKFNAYEIYEKGN